MFHCPDLVTVHVCPDYTAACSTSQQYNKQEMTPEHNFRLGVNDSGESFTSNVLASSP